MTQAFWQTGLSGASLDDLVVATAMNRPSLYAASGDKKATYLKALAHYGEVARAVLEGGLSADNLRDALLRTYLAAICVDLGKDKPARGCFLVSTAAVEATARTPTFGLSSSKGPPKSTRCSRRGFGARWKMAS